VANLLAPPKSSPIGRTLVVLALLQYSLSVNLFFPLCAPLFLCATQWPDFLRYPRYLREIKKKFPAELAECAEEIHKPQRAQR
jgi:hypothetical protein